MEKAAGVVHALGHANTSGERRKWGKELAFCQTVWNE